MSSVVLCIHSLAHSLVLSLSLSLTHTHRHTHSLSLTHTHTHTLSHTHKHTHTHTLPPSLSLSLSLSHTHTHTHTHSTNSCWLDSAGCFIQCLHTLTTTENGVASISKLSQPLSLSLSLSSLSIFMHTHTHTHSLLSPVKHSERVAAATHSFIKHLQHSREGYQETSLTPLHISLSLLLSLKQNSSLPLLTNTQQSLLSSISKHIERQIETESEAESGELKLVSELLFHLQNNAFTA